MFTGGGTESRQPRGQGPVLGAARRRPAPRAAILVSAVEHHAVLDPSSGWPPSRAPRSCWLPVDALGRVRPETLRGARSTHDPDRSPWSPSCGPTTRSAPCSRSPSSPRVAHELRHPVPHRRGAGGRAAAGRLRRQRRRRADRHRPQGRRPARRRARCCCAATSTVRRCCTAAARSATCAPGTLDAAAIAGFAAAAHARRRRAARARRRASGRCATSWSAGVSPRSPMPCSTATLRRGRSGCPATRTCRFPGCEGDALLMLLDARGRRVLDRLGLLGGRRAAQPRAAGDGRRRASGRAARCGSPSATPRPQPTSTRCVAAIAPARRAGPARRCVSRLSRRA